MREEELDWTLYHIIAARNTTTIPELCTDTGFSRDNVEGAMERLERNCLIGRSEEDVRVLSIHESLIMCRVNHAQDSPIVVEDGVIKYRPRGEEK
ncbi:MAG: MarR family transcriptional regulator [Methanomicrobiaceae archaeon]|nr:MarR family transcriptional regulator [Methanomicrobiaceae archaeon]